MEGKLMDENDYISRVFDIKLNQIVKNSISLIHPTEFIRTSMKEFQEIFMQIL